MNTIRLLARLGSAIMLLVMLSCSGSGKDAPLKVEVVKVGDKYQMLVNGQEYRIKGAGLEFGDYKSLADAGANSFRTWRTNNGRQSGLEVLDIAKRNGLTVSMCIELKRERHGMDYSNADSVAAQKESIRKQVIELKNHSALLSWIIGNELNLGYSNMAVWDAVEDIAKMIKEIDGNHPVTTALAGINKKEIDYIKEHCPTLDFISIQMYGDIINLQQRIADAGWIDRPYIITEWGATGHWEMPSTSWGAPIEQSSSEKAASIAERYHKAISQDLNNNLGNYIFLWGQKQEVTPTWYGLFTDKGYKTEVIDFITEVWSGKKPVNSVPQIKSGLLDGKDKYSGIILKKDTQYNASVEALDLNNDTLEYHCEVVFESTDRKAGGDHEVRPDSLEGLVLSSANGAIVIKSPHEVGLYRLFVYVYDGKGGVGTINFPFLVE